MHGLLSGRISSSNIWNIKDEFIKSTTCVFGWSVQKTFGFDLLPSPYLCKFLLWLGFHGFSLFRNPNWLIREKFIVGYWWRPYFICLCDIPYNILSCAQSLYKNRNIQEIYFGTWEMKSSLKYFWSLFPLEFSDDIHCLLYSWHHL